MGSLHTSTNNAYGLNNPSRYTDPTGHFICGDGIADERCEQYDPSGDEPKPPEPPKPPKPPQMWPPDPSLPLIDTPEGYGVCVWQYCSTSDSYEDWWKNQHVPTQLYYLEEDYLTDFAVLWGFNGSTSAPAIYYTGGLEEIVILRDKTRATYNYGGEGGAVGTGASAAAYGGLAVNVKSPEDYRGISAAAGLTVSVLDVGVTASYFWDGKHAPLTPGVVQGFQLGYAPGAQASIWYSNVVYNQNWTSR